MSDVRSVRPATGEFHEYYDSYVSRVREGDIVETLMVQGEETAAFLSTVDESFATFRYEEGKWSLSEVIGHLIDTERVFAYRALRFARGDGTPLPGMDENAYVAATNFDARPFADLIDEMQSVRDSSLFLFGSLTDEELLRGGRANDAEVTVRALAWIIAGHQAHHVEVIRDRYLAG